MFGSLMSFKIASSFSSRLGDDFINPLPIAILHDDLMMILISIDDEQFESFEQLLARETQRRCRKVHRRGRYNLRSAAVKVNMASVVEARMEDFTSSAHVQSESVVKVSCKHKALEIFVINYNIS